MNFLLKASIFISIWYLFYLIFLQRETFFTAIRWYFIVGIIFTFLIPKVAIPIYIEKESKSFPKVEIVNNAQNQSVKTVIIPETEKNKSINFFKKITLIKGFTVLYFLGVLLFFLKLVMELLSLLNLFYKGKKTKKENVIFVEIPFSVAPFSVFNYLFYSKNDFTKTELEKIIAHEKIHIKQFHTLDLILANITTILLWFLPFAWLYKKKLQENLEFIADKNTINKFNKKEYQYLLLKASTTKYPFALSNNFYQSLIKKRIIMLHKTNSKTVNQVKFLLMLPFVAIFLLSFNTKKIYRSNVNEKIKDSILFTNPVDNANVLGISGYGYRMHPIIKKREFHKGIDLIAYKDMDVYATADGTVTKTGFDAEKGNYIEIEHANNYTTKYQHLNLIEVSNGEAVKRGRVIGTIGNTGKSSGYHLHYEILKNGKNINPISYVNYSFEKEFTLNANSSENDLHNIEKAFAKKKSPAKIKFSDVKRNSNNEIIHFDILAKFPNNTQYYKQFTIKNKTTKINDIKLSYIENGKSFKVIMKNSIVIISPENKAIKENNEFEGYNTIIFKTMTDEELKIIANEFRTKNNIDFKIVSYKRNSKNEIIAIKLKAKTKTNNVSYNYNSDNNPIPDIIMAYSKIKDLVIFKELENSPSKITAKNTTIIKTTQAGSLKYEGKTYFYAKDKDKVTFYNRFGDEVNSKLAKLLLKKLKEN